MNRVGIYIFGALLVAAGLGFAAFLVGVPPLWIAIGVLVVLGLGAMGAASSARGTAKTKVNVVER